MPPIRPRRKELAKDLPSVVIDPNTLHKAFTPQFEAFVNVQLRAGLMGPFDTRGRPKLPKMESSKFAVKWEADARGKEWQPHIDNCYLSYKNVRMLPQTGGLIQTAAANQIRCQQVARSTWIVQTTIPTALTITKESSHSLSSLMSSGPIWSTRSTSLGKHRS